MTALYAIAAVIVLAGIMFGAYLVGFGDGITAERMRLRELDIIVKDSIMEAQAKEYKLRHHDSEDYPQQEQRYQLTSADLAQMEQEARNKQAEKEQA